MFIYKGKIEKVTLATAYANSITNNSLFYTEISKLKLHNSTLTAPALSIVYKKNMCGVVVVKVYRRWWKKYSSEVAYFSPKHPNTVNLNYYYIKKKSAYSVTGSVCHEMCHLIDNREIEERFGHTKHNHELRHKSAPYAIGTIAKKLSMRLFGV